MANEPNKKDKKFFKDFKAELKKVIWPSSKQLFNSTSAVIVIVLIIAAIVFVLDVAFESMNTYGIEKIKSLVTSSDVTDNSNVTDGTNETDSSSVTENEIPADVMENIENSIQPVDDSTNGTEETTTDVDENVETDDSANTEDSEQ